MHYKKTVAATDDIEWLKKELLASQELNRKLHRRLQKCEGADLRLEEVISNAKKNFGIAVEHWYERTEMWKGKTSEVKQKLAKLPSIIRWLYKI